MAARLPDGACCLSGGGCAVLKVQYCAMIGGAAHPYKTCEQVWCGIRACCFPAPGYGCEDLPEEECIARGGMQAHSDRSCADNACDVACCKLGHAGVECTVEDAQDCRTTFGTVQWDYDTCDPDPCKRGACCLCRGQCAEWPGMTHTGCDAEGGLWWGDTCEHIQQITPCAADRMRSCRHARFSVSRDTTGTPLDSLRYRPISTDLMEPHEYTRGPVGENCRTWFGNVSATRGAWACGQWNKDNPATKQYVPLQVRIDPVTGRGSFWTSYRPVCPEYEQAGEN